MFIPSANGKSLTVYLDNGKDYFGLSMWVMCEALTAPNCVPEGAVGVMVRETRMLAVERAAFLEQHQDLQNPAQTKLHIVRIATQMVQAAAKAQNRIGEDAPQNQDPRRFNTHGLPVQNRDAQGPHPNQNAAQAQHQANQPRQPGMAGFMAREARHNEAVTSQQALRTLEDGPAGTREHLQNQHNLIQAQLAAPMVQVAGKAQKRLGEEATQNQAPRRCITHGLPVLSQNAQTHQPNQVLAQNPYNIARRAQIVQPNVTGDAAASEHAQRVFLAGNRNPVLNQQNPAQAPYQASMPRQPTPQNNAPMFPAQVPTSLPAPNRNVPGPNHYVLDNVAVQNPVPLNQIQPVQPVGEQLVQLLLPEDRALGAQLYATLEAMKARSRAAHVEAPNPPGQADRVAERQEPAD